MSGGGQEQSSRSLGWGPARDAIKSDLLPGISDYNDQYGGGEGIYQGSQLANQNKFVKEGQQSQMHAADRMKGQLKGNIDAMEGFIDYDPNSPINQARRDAFSAQAQENFNRGPRASIENRGTFAGQFGGPQQNIATGVAMGDMMRDINSFEAQMMEQDRNRAFEAIQFAPGMYQQQLIPGQVEADIGSQRTQRDQMQLMDEIQQYEAPRRAQYQSLLEQSGLLTPLLGAGSQASAGTGGGNFIQGAAGGALAGAGFGVPGAIAGGVLGGLGSL